MDSPLIRPVEQTSGRRAIARRVDDERQVGSSTRRPRRWSRPGAAAHVFAEAFISGTVYLSAIYLTRLSQAVLAISICEHGCSAADRHRTLLAPRDATFLQRSDRTLHGFAEVHALHSKFHRRCGMRTMKTIVASITALLMAASALGQLKKDDEPQSGVRRATV